MIQKITILGSTGSIGISTLDVIARHPARFQVVALTAHKRVAELASQCLQFNPQVAVVGSAAAAQELRDLLQAHGSATRVTYGQDALCAVARDCDVVMAAIVGAAGLAPAMAAAQAGRKILLANKEALVMSGQLFMDAVSANNATLLPIDSEHNAIFQCLPHDFNRRPEQQGIAKIVLTASGGPFLNRSLDSLRDVTPEQAIAHPNWVMGKKISIDSATMMNKGLEVIEAHWLFAVAAEKIEVVIHPQSVIHSMVSYLDGSMLAQLGNPDMRTPIAHALAYPQRIDSGVAQLDISKIAQLNFEQPDLMRFPCLALAFEAFLERKIGFLMISDVIKHAMNTISTIPAADLDSVLAQDALSRAAAHHYINGH